MHVDLAAPRLFAVTTAGRSVFSKGWTRLGALPIGVVAGGAFGAVIGGVLGRILMRVIFLLDQSKDGAETDFGTAGQITVDGSITLAMLCTVTGVMGGSLYVGLRRWLPGSSSAVRGTGFGLLMSFGPGIVFLGEVDLQIFEPAVPIYAAFVTLIVLYGICVAVVTDRVHPLPDVLRPTGVARWAVRIVAVCVLAFAALVTGGVHDNGGTCLSGDGTGGCGIRVAE